MYNPVNSAQPARAKVADIESNEAFMNALDNTEGVIIVGATETSVEDQIKLQLVQKRSLRIDRNSQDDIDDLINNTITVLQGGVGSRILMAYSVMKREVWNNVAKLLESNPLYTFEDAMIRVVEQTSPFWDGQPQKKRSINNGDEYAFTANENGEPVMPVYSENMLMIASDERQKNALSKVKDKLYPGKVWLNEAAAQKHLDLLSVSNPTGVSIGG